ncbi:esterase-like activity of phytase family protein [Alteraurantiacibacter aquimixticola]|uniref:Esterase-like activity of phytase family protein n=1 Tax=Alteraurantiacibacter aquimixticola TaxID=2489173 RepID=A0A4T3EX60_9SPHN|nr:esterase-like activity of phytase family protein [Alteraurantiacibacter aquimixticola]TIX49093.1 esterase-like activity of phytase family protein [Alteraurantiacibacter aquimixticola]
MTASADRPKRARSRLLAIGLLALALAPGTLLRSDVPETAELGMTVRPLAATDLPLTNGGFTRTGLWELDSENLNFGGYSALLALGPDLLRAFSDRGSMLTFPAPGTSSDFGTRFANIRDRGEFAGKFPDIESVTRDPATGTYWLGFEVSHSLLRYDAESRLEGGVQPPEWRGWSVNSGAEAMVRLADGRFIVLPEQGRVALLYPGDPVEGAEALAFGFTAPEGYSPTDMGALPDGRVLVLLRKVEMTYPPFSVRLALADPAKIDPEQAWHLEVVADLDALLPRENYEGMAIVPGEGESVTIWLIADDNRSAFQRSLLARLEWTPESDESPDAQ